MFVSIFLSLLICTYFHVEIEHLCSYRQLCCFILIVFIGTSLLWTMDNGPPQFLETPSISGNGRRHSNVLEHGGKQDQDTGDLFYVFTSLTRYQYSSAILAANIGNVYVSTPASVESYQILSDIPGLAWFVAHHLRHGLRCCAPFQAWPQMLQHFRPNPYRQPEELEKTVFLEVFCQFFVLFFAFSPTIYICNAFFAKRIGLIGLL